MYEDKTTEQLRDLYAYTATFLAEILLDKSDDPRVPHLLNGQLRPLRAEIQRRDADLAEWIANGCPDE